MDRIDAFNVMDSLTEMYVFHIRYTKVGCQSHKIRGYRIESQPFYHKEVCNGVLNLQLKELKVRGFNVTSYYIEKVMVSDVEKQF